MSESWIKVLIKGSTFGNLVYLLSGRKLLKSKVEEEDYVLDDKYVAKFFDAENLKENSEEKGDSGLTICDSETSNLIFVDWDGEDDEENPQNWPTATKMVVGVLISYLTLSAYLVMGIYTPSLVVINEEFNVGSPVTLLGVTLCLVGFGIGPMFLSPLSESHKLGRNNIYIVTFFLFSILNIPLALVKNIAGFCIIRFILGLLGSPAISTGGASFTDIFHKKYLPYALTLWGVAFLAGLSCSPLFGAIFQAKATWRWDFWLVAINGGFCTLICFFFLPETYGKKILYKRAQILRRLTGNANIRSKEEYETEKKSVKDITKEILWRPIKIMLLEPLVLFIDVYLTFVSILLYSSYEAFPLIFTDVFEFTTIETGVSFVGIFVGSLIGLPIYYYMLYQIFSKKIAKSQSIVPEAFLVPAIFAGVCMTIGLFILGWTAYPKSHWMGPVVGAALLGLSTIINYQALFSYLGLTFPRYAASVFAGCALMRSAAGGCFPIFATYIFTDLSTSKFKLAWGATILGCISVLVTLIPIFFYFHGDKLRAVSPYSG